MKKFVKPLVIAASVAAVAGIGAVSFAAWNGNPTSKDVDVNKLGHENKFGIEDATAITGLKPWDQGLTVNEGKVTLSSASVIWATPGTLSVDPDGKTSYSVKVKYKTAAPSLETGSSIWVLVATEAPTIADDTEVTVADIADFLGTGTGGLGFKQLATTDVEFTGFGADDKELNVYLVLVSNDNKDMDKEFSLTYTVSDS